MGCYHSLSRSIIPECICVGQESSFGQRFRRQSQSLGLIGLSLDLGSRGAFHGRPFGFTVVQGVYVDSGFAVCVLFAVLGLIGLYQNVRALNKLSGRRTDPATYDKGWSHQP